MNSLRLSIARFGLPQRSSRFLSSTSPAKDDFFELFQIPRAFSIDEAQLRHAYRSLMKQEHPDVNTSSSDKDMASVLTHAYDTLKRPHRRASHLMELLGHPVNEKTNNVSPGFLHEIMELREKVEHAKAQDQIQKFLDEASAQIETTGEKLQNAIEAQDYTLAQQYTGELQYWNRIMENLRQRTHD